jgi:hypothetical protein
MKIIEGKKREAKPGAGAVLAGFASVSTSTSRSSGESCFARRSIVRRISTLKSETKDSVQALSSAFSAIACSFSRSRSPATRWA